MVWIGLQCIGVGIDALEARLETRKRERKACASHSKFSTVKEWQPRPQITVGVYSDGERTAGLRRESRTRETVSLAFF